jgi:hypothetical protein
MIKYSSLIYYEKKVVGWQKKKRAYKTNKWIKTVKQPVAAVKD